LCDLAGTYCSQQFIDQFLVETDDFLVGCQHVGTWEFEAARLVEDGVQLVEERTQVCNGDVPVSESAEERSGLSCQSPFVAPE